MLQQRADLKFGRSWVERTSIISRRKGDNITMKNKNSAHLGHSVELNKKRRGVKLARLTAGGISTAVAIETQITPFQKEDIQLAKVTTTGKKRSPTPVSRGTGARPNVAEP